VVEGDGACAEEDEAECEGGQSQRELVSVGAHQSIVEVHFDDGDHEIDADGKRGHAGEQAQQHEQTAKELTKRGKIGAPGGESGAGEKLSVMAEAAENLVISVVEHDGTQREAHNEECEGLQAVEVAHRFILWKGR
jgi:hypothetical protein